MTAQKKILQIVIYGLIKKNNKIRATITSFGTYQVLYLITTIVKFV